jgi:hypothetical protein
LRLSEVKDLYRFGDGTPNKSLQVSAGWRVSQLALSGAGCVSPPAPPELNRSMLTFE